MVIRVVIPTKGRCAQQTCAVDGSYRTINCDTFPSFHAVCLDVVNSVRLESTTSQPHTILCAPCASASNTVNMMQSNNKNSSVSPTSWKKESKPSCKTEQLITIDVHGHKTSTASSEVTCRHVTPHALTATERR